MKVLADYQEVLTEVEFAVLSEQWKFAYENKTVFCAQCKLTRAIEITYRCLYCGLWFCFNCAENHFGKTFEDHWAELPELQQTATN